MNSSKINQLFRGDVNKKTNPDINLVKNRETPHTKVVDYTP